MSANRYAKRRSARSEGSGGAMNRDQRTHAGTQSVSSIVEPPVTIKPRRPGRMRKRTGLPREAQVIGVFDEMRQMINRAFVLFIPGAIVFAGTMSHSILVGAGVGVALVVLAATVQYIISIYQKELL